MIQINYSDHLLYFIIKSVLTYNKNYQFDLTLWACHVRHIYKKMFLMSNANILDRVLLILKCIKLTNEYTDRELVKSLFDIMNSVIYKLYDFNTPINEEDYLHYINKLDRFRGNYDLFKIFYNTNIKRKDFNFYIDNNTRIIDFDKRSEVKMIDALILSPIE